MLPRSTPFRHTRATRRLATRISCNRLQRAAIFVCLGCGTTFCACAEAVFWEIPDATHIRPQHSDSTVFASVIERLKGRSLSTNIIHKNVAVGTLAF